jgi:hypothetical protein
VRVLFDNCTAPLFASTLNGFISHYGHAAVHIKDVDDMPDGRNASDVDWIHYLRTSEFRWAFVSGDGRVLKNPAERAALRSAGLHGFILPPAYQKTPPNQVAASLLWHWPEMLRLMEILAAPSMHEIPIRKLTRLRSLPL